ncbi:hypothetical protein D3C80_1622330 [compost metagenome]
MITLEQINMNLKLFLLGIGCLFTGYCFYRWARNVKPSSKETGWEGPTLSNYYGLWGIAIIGVILGIIFILKSLPAKI